MPATAWDADASSPPPPPSLRLIRRRGKRSVPPVDPPDCEPCYGFFRGACSSLTLISMPCRVAPVNLSGSRWATSRAQEINRSFTGKVVAGEFPFPTYFCGSLCGGSREDGPFTGADSRFCRDDKASLFAVCPFRAWRVLVD